MKSIYSSDEMATAFEVTGGGQAVTLVGGIFHHRAVYGATAQLPADVQYRAAPGPDPHRRAGCALSLVLLESVAG